MYVPSDVELVAFAGCTQKFGGAVLLPLFNNIDIHGVHNETLNSLMRQTQMASILPEFLIGNLNSYEDVDGDASKSVLPLTKLKPLEGSRLGIYIGEELIVLSSDYFEVNSYLYRLSLCWLKQQEDIEKNK